MKGYNQYLRGPSGSVVHRGSTGMGREVGGRWTGRVSGTVLQEQNDGRGQGWWLEKWKRRGDLRDS